jgi:small subunit ribosomal protein S20
MANHKSAAKRARQTIKKNAVNSNTKAGVRTIEKKVRTAVTAGDKDTALKTLLVFSSKMDKAAKKGLFHKNTASRKVSRLSTLINTIAK